MFIVNHRALFFSITGLIVAVAISAIAWFGLPLGIDFTGGSLVEVSYAGPRPDINTLQKRVSAIPLGEISLQDSGAHDVIVRTRTLTPQEHTAVLAALSSANATSTELSFTSVGPTLGSELARKALVALAVVVLTIVFYIAWAFRRVSRPVSSWVYGTIVVVILFHDILIPAGFYAILAHFTGARVDSLFAVALLTILGYSVNDTIVIFDRVREHLARDERTATHEEFAALVGQSINETMGRSINTSLTVMLVLLALVVLGSPVTFNFALVLLVGVIAGTYSSILLAAPLLVPVARYFTERRKK
ncbi:MAG: protein translocase subunit SecF [Parcubacteria group bacterium 21-54-25]|nr:MAG: protein translocase subunit SecF [Parcubacteria group bacterium 21-54-25]HQU07479.1 protein translocase subunit SecF [Candidatus Paceibacterota bacterium]